MFNEFRGEVIVVLLKLVELLTVTELSFYNFRILHKHLKIQKYLKLF